MLIRRRAEVIGPDHRPGFLSVRIEVPAVEPGDASFVVAVRAGLVPQELRWPGNRFVVAMKKGREVSAVESAAAGEAWIAGQQGVRHVLNTLWDPIGVSEVVLDEYDSYIEGVRRLLAEGASERALADHLDGVVRGYMGLTPNRAASLATARALLALRAAP